MTHKNSETDYIDFNALYEKYQALLEENLSLKAEIRELKQQPLLPSYPHPASDTPPSLQEQLICESSKPTISNAGTVTNLSRPADKIELFMSLFRGREDVYAKRWESKADKRGYSPVCLNEWKPGVCHKPRTKCFNCKYRSYAPLNEKVVNSHLRGEMVIGIYPLCRDETCHFLAIDFDKDGWQQDVAAIRAVCVEFGIPIAVERSMSGNGAHVWIFFKINIPAATARRLGSGILTHAMARRHEIKFKIKINIR